MFSLCTKETHKRICIYGSIALVFIFKFSEAEESGTYLYKYHSNIDFLRDRITAWHDPFTTFLSKKSCGHTRNSPLEKFPLKTIRLLGVLSSEKRKIAILKTPDFKVYKAIVGSQIGFSGSKVSKITLKYIEIVSFIWPQCSIKSHFTLYISSS